MSHGLLFISASKLGRAWFVVQSSGIRSTLEHGAHWARYHAWICLRYLDMRYRSKHVWKVPAARHHVGLLYRWLIRWILRLLSGIGTELKYIERRWFYDDAFSNCHESSSKRKCWKVDGKLTETWWKFMEVCTMTYLNYSFPSNSRYNTV